MRNALFALALAAVSAGAFAAPGDSPAQPAAADDRAKWADHMGDLPFVIGYANGMKEVEFTGRPPMYFFTTTWWGYCKKLAGSAFKNADVVKVLSAFTPILVDGDTEKEVCRKYGVSGYPNTIFADAKGEAVGAAIVGAIPTEQFLAKAEAAAKKIKPGKPSKDFATLTGAKKKLDEAQAKKQPGPALAAIAEIEKVNRPGAILDAAQAAKKTLLEDGRKRLDAARASAEGENKAPALAELKKLAADYKGTDVGAEAAKLLKDLQPRDEGAK